MKRLVLAALLAASSAHAQSRGGRPQPLPLPPALDKPPDAGDLRRHFGVVVAQRLLASGDPRDRVRAIRRLAAIGTAQAIDVLVQAMDATISPTLQERLEAVRALAKHGEDDGPRRVLVSALRDVGGDGESAILVRESAALALAHGGGARGADALFSLVRQGGPASIAASRALVAHPPENVDGLFGARAPLGEQVATLGAAMGELRAIPWLRRAVRGGDPPTRAASLVAMAALGDGQAELVARGWATETEPVARFAAARALASVAPAEARAVIAALLLDTATRDGALELAKTTPGPELVPALGAIAGDAGTSIDELRRVIAALGASGGVAALAPLTAREDVASDAALALATCPGDAARKAIETLFTDPARRRLAVRAAVARALALGERPAGLKDAIGALAASDRATAVFAEIALGMRAPSDAELASDELAPSAARAVLARGVDDLSLLGPALARATTDRVRDALGVALLGENADAPVSTATLLAWVERGGALAPLAARAIAARDDDGTRARLEALAGSGDPQLRAHVAAGLALSPEPNATGRLAALYDIEVDHVVRRAIVRALARRPDPARNRPLALAASLDPDAATRSIARAALGGARPRGRAFGRRVAWLVVTGDATAVRFELPDGLVVPLVPDADGTLLVPGLPPGIARARVAPVP